MPPGRVLQTGQLFCYDESGAVVECRGTGQDGELRSGEAWPEPRFSPGDATVFDRLTGLTWTRNATPAGFPLTWMEALDFIRGMNREALHGHADWRLPNRRELRSLVSYQARRPALPEDHPFYEVFPGWYWSSTTAAIHPAYAWYVHMDGARMFYGGKEQYSLVWPVRGVSRVLPVTGQHGCFDAKGNPVPCVDTVEDGFEPTGIMWPGDRFLIRAEFVEDRLTGLEWLRRATLSEEPVSWAGALGLVAELNRQQHREENPWRLPNINELESLVDASRHAPALPGDHPFTGVRDVYWSSTTSFFEPDWAWALYLDKGATGVGVKRNPTFFAWPVRDVEKERSPIS
ncbi:MAG: hypothetical protein Kow0089_24110 [Desulfobulbaceae bacterium]